LSVHTGTVDGSFFKGISDITSAMIINAIGTLDALYVRLTYCD